ncbi:MAG TPA: DmsC/YnfH family molybdoenzyme membrane anchor subunit [Burkholderiales bacterium]|nr:DmsC/YnfH family molybdoenzyme membrane anchor subunit [Burkholderiales bacterium]
MRPALSVIFFTVLSGAGLGLFALLALAQAAGSPAGLEPAMHFAGGTLAVALVAAGLISSTFHLANPRNAWRAATQFRYSWLSREAVLALLFFPIALAYLAAVRLHLPFALQTTLGLTGTALAWAILLCTGMIYACLKTIPRWHTPLVPAAYIVNGHLSGSLILLALAAADRKPTGAYVALVLIALAAAGAIKWLYFRRFGPPRVGAHSLSSAIGMTAAQAKLLDAGHTHGTFLTHEFVFRLGRDRALQLRALFFALSLLLPAVVVALDVRSAWVLASIALLCLVGLLIERWLFFAEAQHVVRLFHGQQAV